MRLVGLVALGLFFEHYDLSLLGAALKHIAEDLGIATGDLGFYLGAVRVGGFAAFALVPLADRIGRRRLFLASLVGMSLGTLATGLAQTPLQFLACQVVARAFMLTAAAVGVVMLTEELPAEHRGWGIGILGALGACGAGLGALLFALVDVLPFGWRALYAIGVVPVLLLPVMRRTLVETERFRNHQRRRDAEGAGARGAGSLASLSALARAYPARAACVGLAGMLAALGTISVFQFASYFVQTSHGWAPWQYSVMTLAGGAVGIIGNVVAGRLGDVVGRRKVGAAAFTLYPLVALALYQGPSWVLIPCFAMVVFCASAGDVIVRAFSTELFPTSQRGAAGGWLTLLQSIGWIVGLWLVGAGIETDADLSTMVSAVATVVLGAALCLWLLPETRQQELEALSQEREAT